MVQVTCRDLTEACLADDCVFYVQRGRQMKRMIHGGFAVVTHGAD